MITDPELAAWLAELPRGDHEPPSLSQLRAPRKRPPGPIVPAVTDTLVRTGQASSVPIRSYRHDAEQPRATCVYVHGGGFVFGDLDSHDRACRRLATLGGIDVVAVDYRRAPEHPAPAAIEDVVSVLEFLGSTLGSDLPIGLAGDSAGALIALLAVEATDATIDRLLLINPNVDLTLSMPSISAFGDGWGLSALDLECFIAQWVPDEDERRSSTFNPLQRTLGEVPMTTIVTSECDPLVDEGVALAARLKDAERLARHHHLTGMVHGVINLDELSPQAQLSGNEFLREFAKDLIASRESRTPQWEPAATQEIEADHN